MIIGSTPNIDVDVIAIMGVILFILPLYFVVMLFIVRIKLNAIFK